MFIINVTLIEKKHFKIMPKYYEKSKGNNSVAFKIKKEILKYFWRGKTETENSLQGFGKITINKIKQTKSNVHETSTNLLCKAIMKRVT